MYAIVRRITVPSTLDDSARGDLEHFQQVHESQPGFLGALEIDEGDDRVLVVNLWESQDAAEAGRRAVGAVAADKVVPHAAEPPELVAVGEVSTKLRLSTEGTG